MIVKSFDLDEDFRGQEKKISYLLDEKQFNQKIFNTLLDRSDEMDDFGDKIKFNADEKKIKFQKVRKYLQEVKKNNYTYKQTYTLSECGRYYTKGMSLQQLPREIRGFLCSGTMTDIDIVNAMPSIILMVCDKYNIQAHSLRNYVENRTKLIDKINKTNKKQVSKLDFIICMNRQEKTKSKIPEIIVFDDELKDIQNAFLNLDDFNDIKNKIPEDKRSNLGGCLLNYIYFHFESQINQQLRIVLNSKDCKTCSYQFDGNLILGDYYNNCFDWKDEIVSEVIESLDFLNEDYFKMIFKAHKNSVYMPEDYEPVDNDELYDQYKEEHEKTFFKCNKPLAYIRELNDGNLQFLSKTDFNLFMEDTTYTFEDTKKTFADLWAKDSQKRKYEKIVFDPTNKTHDEKNKYYNTFKGFFYDDDKPFEVLDESKSKYLELLNHIFTSQLERNQFIDWVANIIQKPYRKTNWAIVLYSAMGGLGKNALIDGLTKLFQNYYSKIEKIDDIKDKFNSQFENKFLIYGDEITANAKKLADDLKNLITRSEMKLEKKGIDSYTINDYANFIFTTNNEHCFKIDKDDRRFYMIKCREERKPDEFYSDLYAEYKSEDSMRSLFNFFKTWKITYTENKAPLTDYKKEMMFEQVPAYIQMLYSNKMIERIANKKIGSKQLFDYSKIYGSKRYLSSNYTITSYGTQMKKAIGKFGKDTNKGYLYTFPDEDELRTHLKEYDPAYYAYAFDCSNINNNDYEDEDQVFNF